MSKFGQLIDEKIPLLLVFYDLNSIEDNFMDLSPVNSYEGKTFDRVTAAKDPNQPVGISASAWPSNKGTSQKWT